VSAYKEWPLKSGEGRMAVFSLEDTSGTVRVACFAKQFAQYEALLKGDEPLLVTGKVKAARGGDEEEGARVTKELTLQDAIPLQRLRAERTRQIIVEVSADALTGEHVDQLKSALERSPGPVQAILRVKVPMRSVTDCVLGPKFAVTPSEELL